MAEYEDFDVGSPGPNSSLTIQDLTGRVRCLLESLGQVREMASNSSLGFQKTLGRLDGLAHGMKEVNQEVRSTREVMEEKKAKLDQELDPQTDRAMTKFLGEHLKTATPTENFALCRKIRGSYPDLHKEGETPRPADSTVQQQRQKPQFAMTGLFLF